MCELNPFQTLNNKIMQNSILKKETQNKMAIEKERRHSEGKEAAESKEVKKERKEDEEAK
jgi:hypothetical protein